MKKLIFILALVCTLKGQQATAQFKDIQLHYELGSYKRGEQTIKREFVRTKFQILHSDSLGLMYLNTEFDYNAKDNGVSFAQYSILRSFKLPFIKGFQPTIGHSGIAGRGNYFFAGVLVPFRVKKVMILPLLLYSYNKNAVSADFRTQIGVSTKLFKKNVTVFGFASAWTYDNIVEAKADGKKIGWQISPQIWFNVHRAFAVGTKIDFSRNLYSADKTNDFLPTVGARWTF